MQKYNCVKIYFNSNLTEIINKKKSIISHISRKRIPISVQSKYVIACDGGSSAIRKKIGINLEVKPEQALEEKTESVNEEKKTEILKEEEKIKATKAELKKEEPKKKK